jgi:hypothetical protein
MKKRKAPPPVEQIDEGDVSLRDQVPDPGSVQSNHGSTGYGGDDDRADPDDAKVKGQSRG